MPITKQTIAIIGSGSNLGTSIVKGLCRDNYRLLLYEKNADEAESLAGQITNSVDTADVVSQTCEFHACWEADAILITKPYRSLKEISDRILDVSTQKLVAVTLEEDDRDGLKRAESYFPHSKVVGLFPSRKSDRIIQLLTRHESTLTQITELMSAAGFDPVSVKKSLA